MSNLSGVVREGWLKRIKNQKKRYFVLGFNKETGDAQLQYYENPKKFSAETVPKRVISLQQCLGIIKKSDGKFGNILALYSKEGIFRLKADTDDLLEGWFTDLNKLHQMEYKNLQELKYDMVWKVKIVSRGLGGVKNITGSYKLCLKENTLYFVNPVSQDVIIEEKLYYIRKFGYWDNCVFMEFGRSTALGPGEIWMEVEDPLIAQKIEDSLSRSVKPKSERPERKSMIDDPRISVEQPLDNNNDSPKSRRQTFKDMFVLKKKGRDGLRPHSNSMSSTPAGSAEEQLAFADKNGSLPQKTHSGEDEDSEEQHYPKITPPAPFVPRTKSQSSGSFPEDGIIHRRKGTLDLESKQERVKIENNYANIPKAKRRSERKQDINVVRQNFVEQYKGSSSLPRRTSSSSSGDPSWRHSMGSGNFHGFNYDSDKDSTRESDREDGEAFLQQSAEQYIKMRPRQAPRGSDSSIDEPGINDPTSFDPSSSGPGTYVPLKPPISTPDLYVEMTRPQASAEKLRNTSARSSDSYHSPEEGGGEPDVSTYVNMKPGLRHITSSTSSDDLPGDERFDHLDRGESAAPSDRDHYVNIGPQSANRLKKSRSQIQRGTDNAYMNVDMNRSKSVGGNTPRFRIVSEQSSAPTDSDENRERTSCYVNVKSKDCCSESEANYANFVPQNCQQSTESSPGRNRRELNYASVDFSKDSSPPRDRGSPRRAKKREDNYSKIDFEKSNVLADISSSRERQLHHA